jgi:hypothetical protein
MILVGELLLALTFLRAQLAGKRRAGGGRGRVGTGRLRRQERSVGRE